MMDIHIVGHSFVRRLEDYCRDPKNKKCLNLGLDAERSRVSFVHHDSNGHALSTISAVNNYLDTYRSSYDLPDIVYIIIGSNDLFNNRLNLAQTPRDLALQVLEGVNTLKSEGVPRVIISAALPRTGDGKYGGASHIPEEYLNAHDLWYWEEESLRDTASFNSVLESRIAAYQGVAFHHPKGFSEKWGWKLLDGVHLLGGDPERCFYKKIRAFLICHADQLS